MPTETAATEPARAFDKPKRSSARFAATYAPEIAAQRVPPSACSTSQSTHSVRSPSAPKSVTARIERPISRWISTVRPPCFPRDASRSVRSPVDAGSSEYSAVSQPRPLPYSHRGTLSWIDAVQRSEEHTSELQSHVNLVCRLLLEKKKQKTEFIFHLKKKKKNKKKT